MSTLLQRGFRLLNRCMEPAAAESVRYLRGAEVISDAMRALLSAPQIEVIADGGAAVVGRQFTWRLNRDDLGTKPKRLDRIEWFNGGKTYKFEVLPEAGQPEAGATDPRSDWVPAAAKLVDVQ